MKNVLRQVRLAAGLLVACAALSKASPFVLLNVPLYADRTDQCGPSTLAGLLTFWGRTTDPAHLRQEMYTAKLHGTLPMDLALTAQQHGLKSDMVQGSLELLRKELLAGRPVLVMLNLGYAIMPVNHYVVVTGFSDERKGVFANSGVTTNQFISYKKFMKQWEKTDYWMLQTQA